MYPKRAIKLAGLLVSLLALAFLTADHRALTLFSTPPPTVQGYSFSVANGDPVTLTNINPADILGISGMPLIACDDLGLLCYDPMDGSFDDIQGLSYGSDFDSQEPLDVQFSVAQGSLGLAGTSVNVEANCIPPEPHTDVFETFTAGSNTQNLDGNGIACGSNSGYGLYMMEGIPSDQLDALERDPCLYIDLDCDSYPEDPVFFTLAPGSPSLNLIGASSADILISGIDYVPIVWAHGDLDLGLVAGDVIDAICIRDNGNGRYDRGEQVLFSLAPGSPSLVSRSASPADLLLPDVPWTPYRANYLGLQSTDDVDAMICSGELKFYAYYYLPLIMQP